MRASITVESGRAVTAIFLFALVAFAPVTVQAQDVTLAWDASTDPNVVGYTVHVGINPGIYGQTFDVPGSSATTFTFTQAVPGQRYYFAVSAYDASNVSSAMSNVISWKINVGPTLVQPLNQTSVVGMAASLQLTATDDGDPLAYTATGLPTGMSINASTGRISGTPTTAGTRAVTVSVSDGQVTALRTFTWVVTAPTTPITLSGITSSLASPRMVGTAITFTAVSSSGIAPHQYKWWLYDGTQWSLLRDWTPGTLTWTPALPNANYRIGVWARSAGVTADVSTYNVSVPYVITAGTVAPLTMTSFTSNLASPRTVGTSITFTAAVTGGSAPYQYKFWLHDGSAWAIVRNWSGSNSYTWTPLQANANYRVAVWVRNATTTTDTNDANASILYPITAPATAAVATTPVTIDAFSSNVGSPQVTGTPITFTASVSGGAAPYQFKWWLYNGSAWTIIQGWTGSSSYTWTPTQPNAFYRIGVWVRNATTTADVNDANMSVPYPITGSMLYARPTITSFTSNLASPRIVGTSITFTAAVTGGTAPFQYKFWLHDGNAWTIISDWSGSNSYTWTPLQANSNYRVAVWVRNATTATDTNDANASILYPIASSAVAVPLTITSFTSNLASPRVTGTSITFTAAVAGGTAPYDYKFWQHDGTAWTIARDWSGSNSYTWTPLTANSNYRVAVWVRNATTTADISDANQSLPYVIVASNVIAPPVLSTPIRIAALTSSVSSPQRVGTFVTLRAIPEGGSGTYQYRWWLFDGTTWTEQLAWGTSWTATWRPMQPNANYRIGVWVRDSSSTANNSTVNASIAFPIVP